MPTWLLIVLASCAAMALWAASRPASRSPADPHVEPPARARAERSDGTGVIFRDEPVTDLDALAALVGEAGVEAASLREFPLGPDQPAAFSLRCAGAEAETWWALLRDAVSRTGRWPVILSDPVLASDILAHASIQPARPVGGVLAHAAALDVAGWLDRRWTRYGDDEPADARVPVSAPRPYRLATVLDGNGRPRSEVVLLLLPTPRSWEAAAHLHFGGWNENPSAAEHVALHRHWSEVYGAELSAVGADVLEFRVCRPPRAKADAWALAREQCAYCPDAVEHGTLGLGGLAASLVDADGWYLRWD